MLHFAKEFFVNHLSCYNYGAQDDQTPLPLCDLPDVVLRIIFSKAGLVSILNLRQVCRDLRNRIDNINPEGDLTKILIYVTDSEIRFYCYSTDLIDLNDSRIYIYEGMELYKKVMNRPWKKVRSDGSEKIGNSDFMELASQDLQLILKFQRKCIDTFYVSNGTKHSNNFLQFFDTLESFLASENRLLKANFFFFVTDDQKSVIKALSLMDPRSISTIKVLQLDGGKVLQLDGGKVPMELSEVMKTEQWKAASNFVCDYSVKGLPVQIFRHFSTIAVQIESISEEELFEFKKMFQNSTKAKQYYIMADTVVEREQIMEKMGRNANSARIWYFRLATTDDYVLMIMGMGAFNFERVPVAKVRKGFKIQDW